MRITLGIVSAQPELFLRTARIALENSANSAAMGLIVFGNGWTDEQASESMAEIHKAFPETWMAIDHVHANQGVPKSLHRIWEIEKRVSDAEPCDPHNDIIVYLHDDVDILEKGWDMRVRTIFTREHSCGLAGFAGAKGLGEDCLYKVPYDPVADRYQLNRRTFMSNMEGAEIHGARATTEQEVATVDGFSMIVRRTLLDKIGGWNWFPYVHHAYDAALACQAKRHGYRCWLIPCNVVHHGGKTACGPIHQEMAKAFGGDTQVHIDAHKFLYDNFRDVLPWMVG